MNALNYYGSKVRLAKRYPPPRYGLIVEPFAGGAGYSLRYRNRAVFLSDLDERVVAAWRFLIGASPDDVLSLPDLEPDQTIHDLDVPDGARWVISKSLQLSVGFSLRMSKWALSVDLEKNSQFWGPACRRKLADLVLQIKHWHIDQASYAEYPDDFAATWFVDPPYFNQAGRAYKHGADGIDYEHLGEWCRSRLGQVIVCENEGATWLPFEPLGAEVKGLNRTNATGKPKRSREAVWLNDNPGNPPD